MAQAIGELSFEPAFRGVLPWGLIDNRPYLRSLHSHGLCLWRVGKHTQAAELFERLLWLNPSDNQGALFLLQEVRSGTTWEQCEQAEKGILPAK
jgi:hypothetical protein